MRHRHPHNRRRSPTQNGKNVVYKAVNRTKQRHCPNAPCVRSYPVQQVMQRIE